MTDDVRVGSQSELDLMLHGGDPALALVPDPRVDRAFTLMRGKDEVPEKREADVVTLVMAKSDEQRAAEYKTLVRDQLAPLCETLTRARADGIVLSWALGVDQAGRLFVQSIDSVKPL